MMTRRRLLQAAAAATLAGAGAPAVWALTRRPGAEAGPPEIAYGVDRCDQCGMIVADERFAAAWRDGRTTRRYDDIGCLIEGARAPLAAGRGKAFVHEWVTGDWLEAVQAVYVRAPEIRSPMNYGIAAFVGPRAAQAAYPAARVTTWSDLRAALVAGES